MSDSLKAGDAAAAAVAKTKNRVSLADIEAKVETIDYEETVEYYNPEICPHMTIAFVRLVNGFLVTGESTHVDPDNFDAALGRKFAREDALRKVWRLEGYALCDRLFREKNHG